MTPAIEQVFVKLKTLLRKAVKRAGEAAWKRIGQLLERFPRRNAPPICETQDTLLPDTIMFY